MRYGGTTISTEVDGHGLFEAYAREVTGRLRQPKKRLAELVTQMYEGTHEEYDFDYWMEECKAVLAIMVASEYGGREFDGFLDYAVDALEEKV